MIRFVWKQYRFEILSVVLVAVGVAVAAAIVGFMLNANRPTLALLDSCTASDTGLDDPACATARFWLSLRQTGLSQLIGAVPFVVGGVLGSVLVAREIEHRSAQLGWSLSGARANWLLARLAPVLVLTILVLSLLAVGSEILEGASWPGIDSRSSLNDFGSRGYPLVVRGLAALGIATLAGAIAGRQLPALLVAGVISVVLAYSLAWSFPYGAQWQWLPTETVAINPNAQITDRFRRNGYLTSDGTFLTFQQAEDASGHPQGSEAAQEWVDAHYQAVSEVLVGSQLTEIEVRESLLLASVALLTLGATFIVVDRRRPY